MKYKQYKYMYSKAHQQRLFSVSRKMSLFFDIYEYKFKVENKKTKKRHSPGI